MWDLELDLTNLLSLSIMSFSLSHRTQLVVSKRRDVGGITRKYALFFLLIFKKIVEHVCCLMKAGNYLGCCKEGSRWVFMENKGREME